MGDNNLDKKEYEQLAQFYKETYASGYWLKEHGLDPTGQYFTSAGSIADLEKYEREVLGYEISVSDLDLGTIVSNALGVPGFGDTRIESCRLALRKYKEYLPT